MDINCKGAFFSFLFPPYLESRLGQFHLQCSLPLCPHLSTEQGADTLVFHVPKCATMLEGGGEEMKMEAKKEEKERDKGVRKGRKKGLREGRRIERREKGWRERERGKECRGELA